MSLSNFVSNFNRIYGPFKEWYSKINPANMTGAIDVIVVQQQDGTYLSSPFHVRFGKYGVLKAKEKIVDIEVNDVPVTIHMKLDDNGAAYFVEMVDTDEDDEEIHPDLATSPIPQDSWLLMETNCRKKRTNSCSSSSSSSSLKSISRRRLELVPLRAKRSGDITIAVQTDLCSEELSFNSQQLVEMDTIEFVTASSSFSGKGKLNRKKRRRRDFNSMKHSRNNSKTSLKELIPNDSLDDDAAGYNDDDEETETDDANIFVMEDEKEDFSERAFTSATDSRKNSSTGSFRNNDEMDRAVTGQTPEGVSFLQSRLPDQEKLDSILEHQAELEKQDLNQPKTGSVREQLTVDIVPGSHYFSEPDLTPVTSPVGSRPPSPIMSDSELEVAQRVNVSSSSNKIEEQSWEWGKLPTTSTLKETKEPTEKMETSGSSGMRPEVGGPKGAIENRKPEGGHEEGKMEEGSAGWGLSYLWRGRTKSEKQNGAIQDEKSGIYLDDLKDDDAEMLQIYVGRGRNYTRVTGGGTRSVSGSSGAPVPVPNVVVDDDAESGNGPSLPMSPHSVEGAIGGLLYEDHHRSFRNLLPDVDISLCGGLDSDNQKFSTVLFEQSKVSFDDFVLHLQNAEPSLFNSPDLVVRIGEQYYKWSAACPIIMSTILYGRTLPSDMVEVIRGSYQEPKIFDKLSSLSPSDVTTASGSGLAQKKHSSSWWPFGTRNQEEEENRKLGGLDKTPEKKDGLEKAHEKREDSMEKTPEKKESIETCPEPTFVHATESVLAVEITTAVENIQVVVDEKSAPKMITRYSIGTQTTFLEDKSMHLENNEIEGEQATLLKGKEKFRKTLRLSNEAINCLNLLPGMNEVNFSVTTAYQGTSRCSCHLYLWKWSDKIVISDIDGTITKSDVLGHVLPVIGRDWAQSGVAELFTKIKNNGYHMAYLSARAIGQASFTKDYLASVRQGDINLPDGPLLLNPTSLMNALHREVIEKKPEKFKIACLNDIKTLFPEENNPFFAGYGNRANDVIAYTAVGIPISRIFTINYKGELRHEFPILQTSYSTQSNMVDHLFPPRNVTNVHLKLDSSPSATLEYSNFTFWRDPLPELADDQNTSDSENKSRERKQSSLPPSPTKETSDPFTK